MLRKSVAILSVLCSAGFAAAGTTTIDFTQGIGNLVQLGVGGTLTTDSNCLAVMTGDTTWAIGNGSNPVSSGGTSSITAQLAPANDLDIDEEFGLFIIDPDTDEFVSATVNDLGQVTLTNGLNTDNAQFPAPTQTNSTFTLTYDAANNEVEVTVLGSSNIATLSPAFILDDGPAQFGVFSFEGAKFRRLTATGAGIPNLTSTGTCGGGEGEGEEEGAVEEGEGEEPPTILAIGGGMYEAGDRVELSLQGAEGAVAYQWTRNHADLGGETDETLVIDPAAVSDSGTYRCEVDLGNKAIVVSQPANVEIVPLGALPVGSVGGMALLAGLLAAGGIVRSRKK